MKRTYPEHLPPLSPAELADLADKAAWLEKKMLRYEKALYRILELQTNNYEAKCIAKGAFQ